MKHFKNEERKSFIKCSDEEKLCIIEAKSEGKCQCLVNVNNKWALDKGRSIDMNYVYRVMPEPMTIDEFMKRAGIIELGLKGSTFEALFEELFTDIQERGVE